MKAAWKPLSSSSARPKITQCSCFLFSLSLHIYTSTTHVCSSLLEGKGLLHLCSHGNGLAEHLWGQGESTWSWADGRTEVDGGRLASRRGVLHAVIGYFITAASSWMAQTWWIINRHGLLIISGAAQATTPRSVCSIMKSGERYLKRREQSWKVDYIHYLGAASPSVREKRACGGHKQLLYVWENKRRCS